jgi:hypothetical protein
VGIGRDRVVDAFQAIADRNCAAARSVIPRLETEEACAELFDESQQHGLALLEIVDARNDGRDMHAVIVRCRVHLNDGEREMLVRATETETGWAVSM